MAKFIYKMASVLDIKQKFEDQAKAAFALALSVLNEEEEKLKLLIERLKNAQEEGRLLRLNKLLVDELRDNSRAIDNLKEQVAIQQLQVKKEQDNVERARMGLTNAMQERKTQEVLRDNAFEEFKKEINAAESKEVDELVSYRFGLKANNKG